MFLTQKICHYHNSNIVITLWPSIGKLDDRIDRLEETTALSLLELNTSIFKVLDSAGLDRTRSGFFVDNFVDHTFIDWTDSDHRASIDPSEGFMRSAFTERNARLIYDSDLSTNVIKKGDNIYLKYDHRDLIVQDQCSDTENVNPVCSSSAHWCSRTFASVRRMARNTIPYT